MIIVFANIGFVIIESEIQENKGALHYNISIKARLPAHPNPIALTTSEILNIDFKKGIIQVSIIDANDNSPVLDIKPYTRVLTE